MEWWIGGVMGGWGNQKAVRVIVHFDEDNGFPNEIGKGGATTIFIGLADAEFGGAPDVKTARLAEALE
jgi:hypothetical protein